MKISEFTSLLTNVRQTAPGRWQARCPAHEDKRASLSVAAGEDGRILLKCHAGCELGDIVSALGLKASDLFQEHDKPEPKARKAKAKIVATYDYQNAAGELVYQSVRYEPKDFRLRRPDGDGWQWKMDGIERIPYQLPMCLAHIQDQKGIFIVEGEKDALKLREMGLVATTNAGGAEKWEPAMSELLAGAHMVIIPDNDKPGWNHAALVAFLSAEVAASIRIIELDGLDAKGDVSDWIASGHTKADLIAIAKASPNILPELLESIRLTDSDLNELGDGLDCAEGDSGDNEAFKLLSFHRTDLGNAQAFIAAHGQDLHFCRSLSKDCYLIWSDGRWIVDERGEAQRRACHTIREGYSKLPSVGHEIMDDVFKHLKRSERADRISAMLNLSRNVSESIPIQACDLDTNAWLFNVRNGTIDLRTAELKPHNRGDLISKKAPIDYDPSAKCPRWIQFLDEVFMHDAELIDYIQRIAGYCLTGSIKEQVLFILMGKGSNGKSVFVETMRKLIGDYGQDTAVTTFTERASDASTAGLAALYGSRIVSAAEGCGDQTWDEALLKKLSGGDPITARHLYCPFFTYIPTFKLIVSTNESPRLRGQGYAIKRRVRIIPFKARFYDPQDGMEPVRDPDLTEKLKAEMSGILNWALAGCIAWQQSGLGMPGAVKTDTDKLFADQDPLVEWLDQRCELIPAATTTVASLWGDYLDWCKDNSRDPSFRQAQSFTRNLTQRDGIDTYRTSKARFLEGIQLKQAETDEENEDADNEYENLFG